MSLPLSDVERELTHTRRVRYEGYKRVDGLWDIEAHLTDVKNHDFHLRTGVRRAGQAIHDMWVRITIDRTFTIRDAVASTDSVPYPGGCETIAPAYKALVGLSLIKDFRRKTRELLGGTRVLRTQERSSRLRADPAGAGRRGRRRRIQESGQLLRGPVQRGAPRIHHDDRNHYARRHHIEGHGRPTRVQRAGTGCEKRGASR